MRPQSTTEAGSAAAAGGDEAPAAGAAAGERARGREGDAAPAKASLLQKLLSQ